MKTLRRHRLVVALATLGLFAAILAGAVGGYLAGIARATGIPSTEPLYYSGVLADTTGKLISGTKGIGVNLWTAATAGSKVCSTAATWPTITQGRFRVALDKTCVTAVQQNPELWAEVIVDGTSIGRSKIGAVPYAVESKSAAECLPNNKAATLDVAGDASLTVHSNTDTPTSSSKVLTLKTGKTTPKELFSVNAGGDLVAQPTAEGGITVHTHGKGITTTWTTVFTVSTATNKGFSAEFTAPWVKTGIGYGSSMIKCLVMNNGNTTVTVTTYETQYANADTNVQLQAIGNGNDVLFQARINPTYPGTGVVSATLFAVGNHIGVTKN